MSKVLKTKEAVLEKQELKKYLAKLASDNVVTKEPDIITYPIPRVKENWKYISLVYELLNKSIKLGIQIHPAGEWILDNYYIIDSISKTIIKDLSLKKYGKLPGLINGGFARIYVLANEIVSNTDGIIEKEELIEYVDAYQTQKKLTMEEIWSIPLFLQICLIEKIRRVCEKIFVSQTQKFKVENIIKRFIEKKEQRKINISVEGTYPFIEYMSYKLKQYGKEGLPYLGAFEEQIEKKGIKILDALNMEHFDIAVKKVSLKNAITSMKTISRININEVFRRLSIVEKILEKDPACIYQKMDYKTKSYYKNVILDLVKKTKISEIFITEKAYKLANEHIADTKKSHIGYYLIGDGKDELISYLINRKYKSISQNKKVRIYIITITVIKMIAQILLFMPTKGLAIFLGIPLQNTITKVLDFVLVKCSKTSLIPKLDYQKGIPEKATTMCIVPVILKSRDTVNEMFDKLEVYYLANKSENIYFTLLGDCTSEKKQIVEKDKEIINEGKEKAKKLNEKYGEKFFFIYRKREWQDSERRFMGWERKRGLITQFNKYLKTKNVKFLTNTLVNSNLNLDKIKYIITLDSDTNMVLNSAFELIGAIDHPLNKPEIDRIKNKVIKGYAIIQPRIEIDIFSARKNYFTRLYTGEGGIDLYTNATSDLYQDYFDEGIYTGKGIYDLNFFNKILKDSIPENLVLSHDLLEGCYLRCGLASDIILMDSFPTNYISYKIRKERWIRGDTQIIKWLKSKLNLLSKFKIINNIVRNLNEVLLFVCLSISLVFPEMSYNIWTVLLIYAFPTILEFFDTLQNEKNGQVKHDLFVSNFNKWTRNFYRLIVKIIILPDAAYTAFLAMIKSLYRMCISHCNLLEWTTAEDAETQNKKDIFSYYKSMWFQTIIGIAFINKPFGIIWIIAPIIMWLMGKNDDRTYRINEQDKKYLLDKAKLTWRFFEENTINNLPVDNYQEDRKVKIVKRTSPTNIGLALLSVISAADLKIIKNEKAIEYLYKIIRRVEELQKWNGHLYNWYDLESLKPVEPFDISSVDSGNFVGVLYVVKQYIKKIDKELEERIDSLIENTDFSKLYNPEIGLFSIGFNETENKLYDSYYDLLATEARQCSLIAVAKKDVPAKHWLNLGRTLTVVDRHKGLVSWGGTAFEYLMPNINIPSYESTLLNESCKLLILSEKKYAHNLGIPWGMSESAYSLKDFYGNYQYKTFGIPWLGLKRGLSEEAVVSPYAVALSLPMDFNDSIRNLRRLENEGLVDKYGFYDAIDFKPKKEVVKNYMAHHQGMILTSINNCLNKNILVKRFIQNPEMKAVDVLLQERMPENVIITKEKKDKIEKIKYCGYEELEPRKDGINVISTNNMTTITKEEFDGYTFFDNIVINNGINIYIKNIETNKIYDLKYIFSNNSKQEDNLVNENEVEKSIEYTIYSSKYIIKDGKMRVVVEVTIAPDCQVEIRRIEIFNSSVKPINLEITTYEEPWLSGKNTHLAHPTYDNMFLEFKKRDCIIVNRKTKSLFEDEISLATKLLYKNKVMEFEIDKEKISNRKDIIIPDSIKNSIPFSKKIDTTINPAIAMRHFVKIESHKKESLYLLTSANNNEKDAIKNIKEYTNTEKLKKVFELSKVQTEAENRYMRIDNKNINIYQKMIQELLEPKRTINNNSIDLSNEKIWKYGISGDFPILLVKLKDINDVYIAKDSLKAYQYFLSKNIKLELVFLTDIDIKNEIFEMRLEKYLNKREGIFIVSNETKEEKRILELRASLVIDAHNGLLKFQIE